MNADRRKKIAEAQTKASEAAALLREVAEGEQEAFDGMPENMQGGDKGQKMEAAIGALEEWADQLEEIANGNVED